MPFGMRYIAKELRALLEERFPDSSEEVDKVIANLLYYRYMNPAIVYVFRLFFALFKLDVN
jgi:hypothetical protein